MWKRALLGLMSCGLLLQATCATDVRDAVVAGALDYISGATGVLIDQIVTGAAPQADAGG